MIIELFLNIIYWLVGIILTPLQVVFQPLGSFLGLIELLSYGSIFIPLTVFGQCLSMWLGFHGFKFIVVLVNWLIGKIPTIS
jgi:hypothetical protein